MSRARRLAAQLGRAAGAAIVGFCFLATAAAQTQQLPGDFVFLRDIDPTILQDIRYAGANNFVGRRLSGYDAAECVVKRRIGLALKSVQA